MSGNLVKAGLIVWGVGALCSATAVGILLYHNWKLSDRSQRRS